MKDMKESIMKLMTLPNNVDINTFKSFLHEIYISVTKRCKVDFDFYCFAEVTGLPLFISEKVFRVISNYTTSILKSSFSDGLALIYYGTHQERTTFLFKVLDFDNDDQITIDDTKQFFTFFHTMFNTSKTLKLLFEIIDGFFEVETVIDKTNFEWKSQYKNYDIVMLFIQFIHSNLFYSNEQLCFINQLKRKDSIEKRSSPVSMEGIFLTKRLLNYVTAAVTESPRDNTKDFEVINEDEKELEELDDFENQLTETMSNLEHTTTLINQNENDEDEDDPFYDGEYEELGNFRRKSQSSKLTSFLLKGKGRKTRAQSQYESNTRKRIDSNGLIGLLENDANHVEANEIILYSFKQANTLEKIKLTLIRNVLFTYVWNNDFSKFTYQSLIYLNSTYPEVRDKIQIEDKTYYGFHLVSTYHHTLYELSFYSQNQVQLYSFASLINTSLNFKNIENDYVFNNELGRGKFGIVKLASSKENQKHYAIKIVNKFDKTATDEDYKIFQWEKTIFSFLINARHPNVVKAINIYETHSNIYYVTENITGGDLKQFVKSGKMTAQCLVSFSFQLINGLNYLHTFGIIHRDIKHTNILISKSRNGDNILKLIDFGLGRIIGKTEYDNSPYGSLSFKAPEILLKKDYNSKTDIWSAGITIYYIAFQELPFVEKNKQKLIEKITNSGYAFPSMKENIRGNCDYSFVYSLINDCLTKDFQIRLDSKKLMKKYFINFRTSGDWL